MNTRTVVLLLILLIILLFRIFLGIQINFVHKDYYQIYLIGLEFAISGDWPFWGPDIVWSKTRLPGAMQGLLAGVPLSLTQNAYAPIVFSNLLSFSGLVLLGWYATKRFLALPKHFIFILITLLPFCLLNGAVLLNTAYLIFSGALLFFAVFELFIYRKRQLLENPAYYYALIGFALLFTYQLHLTWVMILPFIVVLFFLEWQHHDQPRWEPFACFSLGALAAGITLIPTVIFYPEAIFSNAAGNLTLDLSRIGSIGDLFIRYLGYAIFDLDHKSKFVVLAGEKNAVLYVLIWVVKIFTILQFIAICIALFLVKRSVEYKKLILLFVLTMIMALFLYVLSNKHLASRTYILLYPIPVWISLYTYSYWTRFRYVQQLLNTSLVVLFVTLLGIGIANYGEQFSFQAQEEKIYEAIKKDEPREFARRRRTLMDKYQ